MISLHQIILHFIIKYATVALFYDFNELSLLIYFSSAFLYYNNLLNENLEISSEITSATLLSFSMTLMNFPCLSIFLLCFFIIVSYLMKIQKYFHYQILFQLMYFPLLGGRRRIFWQTEIFQKTAAAGSGNWSTTNGKFYYYSLFLSSLQIEFGILLFSCQNMH